MSKYKINQQVKVVNKEFAEERDGIYTITDIKESVDGCILYKLKGLKGYALEEWILSVDEVAAWDNAYDNVVQCMLLASSIPTAYFYITTCKILIDRYKSGERTEELLQKMREVH